MLHRRRRLVAIRTRPRPIRVLVWVVGAMLLLAATGLALDMLAPAPAVQMEVVDF